MPRRHAALTCPCSFIWGTRAIEGLVDDFPQTRSVVDDLRSGKPTCGFRGSLLAHFRRPWLQLLGGSVSPSPSGPDPDVLEVWGVAVEDWDAESILPTWLQRVAPIGILEEVSRPLVPSRRVTLTSSQGTQLLSARVSPAGSLVLQRWRLGPGERLTLCTKSASTFFTQSQKTLFYCRQRRPSVPIRHPRDWCCSSGDETIRSHPPDTTE